MSICIKKALKMIEQECDEIKELLLKKNKAYGNSVFEPLRIFAKSSLVEQINVRIDDKISRIMRGYDRGNVPEDTEKDLIGYLIIKRVAQKLKIPDVNVLQVSAKGKTDACRMQRMPRSRRKQSGL